MGGDHKCPLCSATFTRPQHVGRHLRAHTGDRPYECKECPLRFARSDLLSRHVNKAHKAPDENGKPPAGKKGRRKSMPSSAHPGPHHLAGGDPSGSAHKPRRASFNHTSAMGHDYTGHEYMEHSSSSQPIQTSATPAPQHPPLQAQSMYPHHPLLAGTPQPSSSQDWTSSPPMDMGHVVSPSFASPYYPGYSPAMSGGMGQTLVPNGLAPSFQPPFTAVPMHLSGSEQGYMGASPMGRHSSAGSLNSVGYEFGFKKRACDQCNHSKVRCDFAEPCHRCAHRNLKCSYNKPQKSRTIATIPTQRMSLPNSGANATLTSSYSASSYSPQSHSSSPHSSSSPLNSTMPPPNVPSHHTSNSQPHPQPQPQTALPSGMPDPNSYMQAQNWSQSQWQPMGAPPMDPSLGLTQQNNPFSQSPRAMAHSSTSSNYSQLPVPLPRAHSGSSSISSPHTHLAATPSLTSHSTSPGSEEPAERRTSSSSFTTNGWSGDYLKGKSVEPIAASDPYATGISPTIVTSTTGAMYPIDTNTFAWAPPVSATIDPRFQFRNSLTGDDDADHVSRPPSSAASTFHEGTLDEASLAALNERRRSSLGTGIWASAFHQMSLQDGGNGGTIDPYTASQVAQARRPSFPGYHPMLQPTIPEGSSYTGSYSSNSGKIPSLGDVKDLWKQFMAEPMTGGVAPAAMVEQIDPLSAMPATASAPMGYGNAQTPVRPAMATRGLSKSNSMPDLTSPLANAQPFFSTYNTGATPRPAVPQSSYTLQQAPVDGNEGHVGTDGDGNAVVMRRWKDSIKNRQASFEFDPNAQVKIKSTSPPTNTHPLSPPSATSRTSSTVTATPSQSAVVGVPTMNANPNRPRASVLQHSSALQQPHLSALQQTLAPERAISFGLDNLPTPLNKPTMRANAAKFSSALARPGNKRLASQTLVPSDHTKKTSGDVLEAWHGHGLDDTADPDADGADFMMPGGLIPGSTGMTPVGSGPGGQGQYFGWNNTPGMVMGGVMSNGSGGHSQGM